MWFLRSTSGGASEVCFLSPIIYYIYRYDTSTIDLVDVGAPELSITLLTMWSHLAADPISGWQC